MRQFTYPAAVLPGLLRIEFVFLLLYAAIVVPALVNHAMWGDETQAWLIARDSRTIRDLLLNLRYEGHPILYYLLIMPLTRMSADPETLKILNVILMAVTVAIVLWRAPFTLIERALFPFGYFMVFEYAVKSRGYALGCLLVVIFCALWPRRFERPIAVAVVLALLANVHILFTILSGAAVAAVLLDRVAVRRSLFNWPATDFVAAGIVIAGWSLALWVAVPAPDMRIAPQWFGDLSVNTVLAELRKLSGIFGANQSPVLAGAAGVLLVGTLVALRRNVPVVAFLLLSIGGLLLFFIGRYPGHTWHQGFFFIAFAATLWLDRATRRGDPAQPSGISSFSKVLFPGVLAMQCLAGAAALRDSFHQPYSNSRNVAQFLKAKGWSGDPIFGSRDFPINGIVAYLGIARAHYGLSGRWGSFIVWDRRTLMSFDLDAMLEEAARIEGPVTFIAVVLHNDRPGRRTFEDADQSLDVRKLGDAGFVEVARFEKAEKSVENFVVYRRP